MTIARTAALLLAGTTLVACGGDDPMNPLDDEAEVLAEISVAYSAGVGFVSDSVIVWFIVGDDPDAADRGLIIDAVLRNGDEGTTVTIDSGTEFDEAVDILTNGTDETGAFLWSLDNGPGSGAGNGEFNSESGWIDGGATGTYDPDLTGAEITHFLVQLETVDLDSPGSDVNGDGEWTDVTLDITLQIMGHP